MQRLERKLKEIQRAEEWKAKRANGSAEGEWLARKKKARHGDVSLEALTTGSEGVGRMVAEVSVILLTMIIDFLTRT